MWFKFVKFLLLIKLSTVSLQFDIITIIFSYNLLLCVKGILWSTINIHFKYQKDHITLLHESNWKAFR